MKKISLYIMALLAVGLTSCKEDIESPAALQPNPQESVLKASDVTFTPASVPSIDLRNVKTDDTPILLGSVAVKEGAMSSDMRLKAVVQVAKSADFSDAKSLEAEDMINSNEIKILPSKLHTLYIDEFTLDPNPTTLYMRTNLYTVVAEESQASIGDPRTTFYGTYTVPFQPYDDGVRISNVYYAIVQQLDGSFKEVKCTHKVTEDNPSTNVYDNPIFEVEFDALKNVSNVRLDTKFAFVPEEDLANYKSDASVLYGDGGNKMMVKGGPFLTGPADDDAYKYIVTIDMKNLTIITEPVVLFYSYYLYTNHPKSKMKAEDPETDRNYMFYRSDFINMTTYTYTTFWPNNEDGRSDMSVKVWERTAMLASTTTKTWGFSGAVSGARKESGDFKQPGQWIGPLTEGWYTFTITMDESEGKNQVHKYQWTGIDAPTTTYANISLVVDGADVDLTECAKAPHNWYLLGYQLTETTQVKFRANHSDAKVWGGNGTMPISQVNYSMPTGTADITVPAGTYDIYLNDITGNWSILKIK